MMWAFGLFVSGVVCAVMAVIGFQGYGSGSGS